MSTLVRVTHEHQHCGDAPDYHEWVFIRWIKADKRGYPNPRMYRAHWQFWRCNNTDCPAEALVSDDLILAALDAAAAGVS